MVRPVWLIEGDVFGQTAESLHLEIKRQGMTVYTVKHRPHAPEPRDIIGSERLSPSESVIFMGTHPLMRHIQLHRRWRPGGWCTFPRFACSNYYAYFGPYVLNQDYTLLPGVEALRHRERLFDRFGESGKVFVRPDSVRKIFTGTLSDQDSFDRVLAPSRYDPVTLVLIARPRRIKREWRLVIANSAIVASSLYREDDRRILRRGCPEAVSSFAEGVLSAVSWRPDPLFMMDICETEHGYFVLELNSFSCSGLYECDLKAVVQAASECAAHAW